MTDLDDLDLFAGAAPGLETPPKRCKRHSWVEQWQDAQGHRYSQPLGMTPTRPIVGCSRCPAVRDPERSRRNKNNGKRGRSDELKVARILGGRKMGPLGLPWDVEIPGYLRVQAKQLDRWPSVAKVIEWLDAIPVGPEMRAVTLADTPGPGRQTRRLIVLELGEFADRHGKGGTDD